MRAQEMAANSYDFKIKGTVKGNRREIEQSHLTMKRTRIAGDYANAQRSTNIFHQGISCVSQIGRKELSIASCHRYWHGAESRKTWKPN
ncbi:hypothetical protein X777_09009 [Ooceraea biroi]|uniref:Uncharacterized protein n=1 Tax=Ooceraea biroi TaxID=2015173 RepID=A0A026WBC1_OOCBI|nr:hypothetical protein X777_09009 [Ooceraea biroi]